MSDLREALDKLKAMTPRDFRAYHDQIDTAIAALSAQPQPEAVEAVAWLCVDKVERRQHITTSAEDAADRRSRPGVWTVTPLYTAPPLASDGERMRRALEHARSRFEQLAEEFEQAKDTVSWAMCSTDAKMMDEALSRADDGKKSEGGKPFDVLATIDPDHSESFDRIATPSDPTPAEQREWPAPTSAMLNGDALFDAIWQAIKSWDVNVPSVYSGYCGANGNHARAIYDAILALSTRAGG